MKKSASMRSTKAVWLRYALLILAALIATGPFLWLLSTALKGPNENLFAQPPQWLPSEPTLANFVAVWEQLPLLTYLGNSLAVAVLAILLNLTISVLAAYPLARMRFTGQLFVMVIILGTLMIPFHVLMIPLYLLMQHLGLNEAHGPLAMWLGLAFPVAVSGFGMLLIRQAMISIPQDLEDAAHLDGASSWQTLWHVLLPQIQPALATLAVFTLMASWGEFLWPSLMVQETSSMTLPVGLVQLQGQFGTNWRYVAAGTLLAMIPTLLLFLVLQRWLKPTEWASASKG